jgi:hypothetical protein
MEKTRSTGLMSRRYLVWARGRRPSPFEGSIVLFRGCDVEFIQEWAAQCHGVDTGLPAQLPHSARDGLTGKVGGTAPRYDARAVSKGRHGEDSPLT